MFSRKKLTKSDKSKNVAFESTGGHNESARYERDGSNSGIGLWENSREGTSQEEMERIVAPFDRFEWLLDYEDCQPEVFVSADTHHYDEEDYRDHRHRAYPHMHQPLKSMEPRVLMEIKSRIKVSRRAEERAATAGVASSVPGLLAIDSVDARVLIDSDIGVSGPVLSLVREPGEIQIPISRKKRKRKRKRSRKQEPFQPTLCKLSEESSSPLHNIVTEDGEDKSIGGLVLEELNEAMRSIRKDSSYQGDVDSVSTISFLEEIASLDLPIGFLDMTNHYHAARQHSLPFFENVDRVDDMDNITTSRSVLDLKKSNKHLKFLLPDDFSDGHHEPLINISQEPDDVRDTDAAEELMSSNGNQVVFSSTYRQGEPSETNLNQVASTSAITSDSSIKISNCNFQIGSVDSVTVSQQNIFNVDLNASCNRSVSGPAESHNTADGTPQSHHHHHHHRHHKEHYNKRDLEKRTFSGQDMRSLWQSKDNEELDEYESTLGDAIIDDMKHHRCHDMPALNRTRIHNRYVHSNKKMLHRSRSVSHSRTEEKYQRGRHKIKKCTTCEDDAYKANDYTKSQQDLIFQSHVCGDEWNSNDAMDENPFSLFVEMDVLKSNQCWREISRWVRYEQCYNELSDTFGRAHSSPLKFTAFTQFRVQLEDAIFMPHVDVKTFDEAINQLTEELLVAQLFAEPRDALIVREVLKWKHMHPGEKFSHDASESCRSPSESAYNIFGDENHDLNMRLINTSPVNLDHATRTTSAAAATKISFDPLKTKTVTEQNINNKYGQHPNFPSMIKMLKNSIPILRHQKYHKSDLEGHLPLNSEGVTVQVGALENLKKPFLAIMRFKSPMFMDRVIELNIPIRFLIVCLGPPGKIQYEELGRVISTMLVNKDFCKLMYHATDKCEIIEGLYKYLDSCFVLSFSGPHPAKNMHTMVDHISDFVRVETNPVLCQQISKEPEGIKHSLSVDKTNEQHSQIMRCGDSVRYDMELGKVFQDEKVMYEESTSGSKGGDCHVYFRAQTKSDGTIISRSPRHRSPIQYFMCGNMCQFLFRLLRLDLIKYKDRFISDLKDAFMKENIVIVLCGLVYLYFVCLSPALTFGVLLGDLVSSEFNVQMVLVCNGCMTVLFALVGGNPLLVVGITGPMFLMETVIGKMATSFNLPIMLYRLAVALYVSVIGLVSLAFNVTWVMQKVRRSVEECFNGFVGIYFVFKAAVTIVRIFVIRDPKSFISVSSFKSNDTVRILPATGDRIAVGFASLVLAYSMYQICMVLNSLNRSRFFTRKFRKMVDYFNVAIGILVLSLVNVGIINVLRINLPTLKAETVNSTWIKMQSVAQIRDSISFVGHMTAFLLALALMSLIFTETAISGITATKTEKKLVKSSLFAQDQFLCLCIIPVICGLFSWPFLSGAAVRSTSHVMAMTKWDHKVIPGVKHKILGVVEQRVTMLVVGVLVLATVCLESVLGHVPTAAMLGMFLYMGVMGVRDLVVTRRLIALFKRRKHWKDHEYLRDIPPCVLKLFELLQLALIAVMFAMNCISEFAGIYWTSFLIPIILLVYAVCREAVLPRLSVFGPHLDKLDPRHFVQMAVLCPSQSPDKERATVSRPPSANSAYLNSSQVVNDSDTKYDVDDSANTSGDEVSSSSYSEADS